MAELGTEAGPVVGALDFGLGVTELPLVGPVALPPVEPLLIEPEEVVPEDTLPEDFELAPVEPDELEPLPMPEVPHAERTNAQARGIAYFNIRISYKVKEKT